LRVFFSALKWMKLKKIFFQRKFLISRWNGPKSVQHIIWVLIVNVRCSRSSVSLFERFRGEIASFAREESTGIISSFERNLKQSAQFPSGIYPIPLVMHPKFNLLFYKSCFSFFSVPRGKEHRIMLQGKFAVLLCRSFLYPLSS